MQTQVSKWGNSLGVRIPKALADEAHLSEGTEIELSVVQGNVVLSPVNKIKYRLEDLLAQITDENIHPEISSGPSVGREAW
ncbi:MAG: AbrB/MazE/SpoVT family DNA-binding domain-containing protein [Candidatus Hydrogenedentes bacterium]|nr:AbrB/MazE/SpoVT family DNA-binding domain-containing protein [Candidatus Hydrogenedentota bacterium]